MIARVEFNNNIYYSYVFAHFQFDYMDKYVVFNTIKNKFEIVSYLSKECDGHRQIGLINESEKEFIYKKEMTLNVGNIIKCAGYPWLINNEQLFKQIELGDNVDEQYIEFAKNLNETIDPNAWILINNQEDADDLMAHVGVFHDYYLIKIEAISEPYDTDKLPSVQLRFTSQGAFDVLLEFEGAYIKYNFAQFNRIYLSSLIVDDYIYWVDGDEELTINDIEGYSYIQSKKLKWKFILKENHNW